MRHGTGGEIGIVSNVESTTYSANKTVNGTTPTSATNSAAASRQTTSTW